MRNRFVGLLGPVVVAGCLLAPAPAGGQAWVAESVCAEENGFDHAAFHACALEAAKTFEPPRTPDGHPDLSGIWRRRASAFEDLEEHPRTPDDSGGPSVVVDPPDGKVPIQPWADAQRRKNAERYLHHNAACFLAGTPGTMYMANVYQFLQTRDYLVITGEQLTVHPYRIIPLDGRPHIGRDILLWQGDSRGRWEGNTLVIETTNQNGRVFLDQRGRFYTEEAHVIERLTLVDANTLHFEATIEDPNVYTRPFTMAFALRRNAVAGHEIWEESCYEVNEEQMELFRRNGYRVYPGITASQARELQAAWKREEEGQR